MFTLWSFTEKLANPAPSRCLQKISIKHCVKMQSQPEPKPGGGESPRDQETEGSPSGTGRPLVAETVLGSHTATLRSPQTGCLPSCMGAIARGLEILPASLQAHMGSSLRQNAHPQLYSASSGCQIYYCRPREFSTYPESNGRF